ncbi:MAG: hypothetical protein PUB01_04905, partial [Desulfovibrionaceae bacterium]|nr:hypothetical protein [Desulfovibrionaceae bacterium]
AGPFHPILTEFHREPGEKPALLRALLPSAGALPCAADAQHTGNHPPGVHFSICAGARAGGRGLAGCAGRGSIGGKRGRTVMARIPQKFTGLLGKFAESLNYDDLPKGWADNPEIVSAAEELYQKMGTKSPFFRAWFGDSKVVDEAGNPLKVYHGTNAAFDTFRNSKGGTFGPASYFTPDRKAALEYANNHAGDTLKEVFLASEKPYAVQNTTLAPEKFWNVFDAGDEDRTIRNFLDTGYDAVWAKEKAKTAFGETSPEIAVFSPNQIKASSNRGTFNPDDPNIYRSALPLAVGGAGAAALGMSPDEAEAAAVPGFSQMYDRAVRDGSKKVMYAGTLDDGVYQQAARRDPAVLNNQVFIGPHAGNARYGTGEMTPLEVGQHVENMLNSADTKVLPGFPSANYRNNAGNMLFLKTARLWLPLIWAALAVILC